jgi:hypothetical protein
VPATATTVNVTNDEELYAAEFRHAAEVDEVQLAVWHGPDALTDIVLVNS